MFNSTKYHNGSYSPRYKQKDNIKKAKTIWLDNVFCGNNRSDIQECTHDEWGIHNCGHSEDVGIRCYDERSVKVTPLQRNGNYYFLSLLEST